MKIIVPCKCIRSPYTGSAAGLVLNPFDEVALEEAVMCLERGIATDVIAVTLGAEETTLPIRHATARGATRTLRIDAESPLEPLCIARALAAVVRQEGADLVLMGKLSADDDNAQVGPMLAGLLGWPQITSVTAISVDASRLTVACLRQADGREEEVESYWPAVVTTDIRLNMPRATSLPKLARALKTPLEIVPLESLGVPPRCRCPLVTTAARPARRPPERLADIAALLSRIEAHLSS